MRPGDAEEDSVLGLLPLLEAARERGIDGEALLAHAGIAPTLLDNPRAAVPVRRMNRLIERLLAESRDAAIGLCVGGHYQPTTFGVVGAAAAVAPTVADATRLFAEYAHGWFNPFQYQLTRDGGGDARIVYVDSWDVGPLRRYYLDRSLAVAHTFGRTFWPDRHRALMRSVDIDYAEPPESARYRALFGCPVRFGARQSAMHLDLAAEAAREGASTLGFQLVDDHLRSSGLGGRSAHPLTTQVRRAIAVALGERCKLCDAEEVAAKVGLSERALRRGLAAEGTSFRTVVERVAMNLACRLLRQSDLPVAEVAERLGYSEPSSFVRAFRRWTGATPHRFRAE